MSAKDFFRSTYLTLAMGDHLSLPGHFSMFPPLEHFTDIYNNAVTLNFRIRLYRRYLVYLFCVRISSIGCNELLIARDPP